MFLAGQYVVCFIPETHTVSLWDVGVAGQVPLEQARLVGTVTFDFQWRIAEVYLVDECLNFLFLVDRTSE